MPPPAEPGPGELRFVIQKSQLRVTIVTRTSKRYIPTYAPSPRGSRQSLADHGPLGGADLVEAAHGRGVGSGAGDLGIGGGLAEDLGDGVGEGVEGLLGLGLGGLDHESLLDEQGEVDGGGMEAEVEQALGEVEG